MRSVVIFLVLLIAPATICLAEGNRVSVPVVYFVNCTNGSLDMFNDQMNMWGVVKPNSIGSLPAGNLLGLTDVPSGAGFEVGNKAKGEYAHLSIDSIPKSTVALVYFLGDKSIQSYALDPANILRIPNACNNGDKEIDNPFIGNYLSDGSMSWSPLPTK